MAADGGLDGLRRIGELEAEFASEPLEGGPEGDGLGGLGGGPPDGAFVEVRVPEGPSATYGRVTADTMRQIVSDHIVEQKVVSQHVIAAGTEAG